MVFTKEYLQKQVKIAVKNSDGAYAVCIPLHGDINPVRHFIMSYNVQRSEVMGIVEKIGRYGKRPIKLRDIIR